MAKGSHWVTAAAVIALGALALTNDGGSARADDKKPGETGKAAPATPATPAAAALERLKKLAGDWAGKNGNLAVTYRVTAGVSAVMETLLPGSPHEMVTMYHLDGGDLVLVHYCALGNQPRMKWKAGGDPSTLVFEFAGGSNFDPAKDMHMHEVTITLKDDDHIHSEWTAYKGAAKQEPTAFDHTRMKK